VPRTGRRPGAGGTREKILAAARTHLGKAGYDGGTVRGIRRRGRGRSGPRAALLRIEGRCLSRSDGLSIDPAEFIPRLLAPGLDGLGERLARFFLDTWDSPAGQPPLGLIRSVVGSEDAAALLREFVSREVLGRLAKALEVDQPRLRASLAGSSLIGLAMLRYVVKIEPLASASSEQVAAWVGPAIQRYLTDSGVTVRPAKRRAKTE
jgi:hypothetical protein